MNHDAWVIFWRGTMFGVLITILFQAIVIYNVVMYLTKPENRITKPSAGERPQFEEQTEIFGNQTDPEYARPWPRLLTERIKRWLEPTIHDTPIGNGDIFPQAMSPTTECEWLNVTLSRMFLILRSSKSHIKITDVLLGEEPPYFEGVRLLKGISNDVAVMSDLDLVYRGGASVVIQATLSNGMNIPVQVYMNEFKGTIRSRLPSEKWEDMIGFSFVRDPGVTFKETWVLPSWRTNFVPLLEPTLEDWLRRQEQIAKLAAEPVPKKARTTIATRATQLWEATSMLKRQYSGKSKDILEGIAFDTNTLLPVYKEDQMIQFERPLIHSFIELANEPVQSKSPGKNKDEKEPTDTELLEDTSDYVGWKSAKAKQGIVIQKKVINGIDEKTKSELHRGTFTVACDSIRVCQILSNPIHFEHVHDNFQDSKILFSVFQTKITSEIDDEEDNFTPPAQYIVMRSVGGFKMNSTLNLSEKKEGDSMDSNSIVTDISGEKSEIDDDSESGGLRLRKVNTDASKQSAERPESPMSMNSTVQPSINVAPQNSLPRMKSFGPLEQEGLVYLFGYQVVPNENDSACSITVLSQFSNELKSLEVDFQFCRKLKSFIEELTQHTDHMNEIGSNEILAQGADVIKRKSEGEGTMKAKIANYIGNTATYLLKGRKLTIRNPSGNSDSVMDDGQGNESGSEGDLTHPEQTTPAPIARTNTSYGSISSMLTDFAALSPTEKVILPRAVSQTEIAFNRESYGPAVSFAWEYTCLTESTPLFGINFVPDGKLTESVKLLPFASSITRVIFPLTNVQSYTCPSFGSLLVSDFPSGKFVFIWDNSALLSKKFQKIITFKTVFRETDAAPENHAQVAIPRKSFFSLTFIYDPSIAHSSTNATLNCEFTCSNAAVPFALYYDPIIINEGILEEKSESNIANRLQDAMNGEVTRSTPTRKTLVPYNRTNKNLPLRSNYTFPITGNYGAYTAVWDNSASIVSTRVVDFHLTVHQE
ncbi:hypothetical protein HK103_006791 [Boothiomyces macroporosus]|uniref:Uncharacterized protein n=1 Tax=Boothiomyces macroporosus TaxID=261099 RepID=A0AAD5Y4E6_9FUNG|nr:hypothetical protein HK103_006791 [Boothiomyces macroporosus]